MKVKSFLLGLLAMTAVVACQEDQLQETPKLDLGSESVTVPAEGQDVTFTVTSNVAWTATSDKEWATVDPSSGDGSDSAVTVTVEVAANDEEAARTAVITVAAGDLTKTFTISQSATGGDVTLDGKQWTCTWLYDAPAVFDFGVTAEGMFYFAYYMQDVWAPMYQGEYIIEKTDATTGIVHLNLLDPYSGGALQVNMPYSELTSTSVTFDPTELEAQLYFTEPFVCTAAEDLITISVGGQGGEAGLDGYQWIAPNPNGDGTYLLLDFSASEAGIMYVATGDGENFTATKVAEYAVDPLDETSGIIYFVEFDPVTSEDIGEEQEWAYEALEDGSVTITLTEIGKVTFDVTEDYYPITTASDAAPSGKIENGQYWFLEGTKFAEPYAGDKTYGYLPASEGVDNGGALATLASNAFTFTYYPDHKAYTIQDSYGRYLGAGFSADGFQYNTFNFATSLPVDDMTYLWVVADPSLGDYNEGEFDIYNKSTWWSISYDTSNGWGSFNSNTENPEEPFPGYPTLVKADNPVESLPEPAGPVEATIAEFIAAEDSTDVVYRVSGTIVSIAEISASYKNATFDIADEDGKKVTVFRMKLSSDATTAIENLGLTVGDYVTVEGNRVTYYGSPQMSNGIYVSHEDREAPVSDADVVVDLTAQGYENAAEVTTLTVDGVTLTFDKGTGSTTPKFYTSGSAVRVYAKGTLTVAASQTIEKIVFVYGSSDKTNEITADSGEFSVDTWTGSADSVVFTVGGTKDHRRFAKVEVYYASTK